MNNRCNNEFSDRIYALLPMDSVRKCSSDGASSRENAKYDEKRVNIPFQIFFLRFSKNISHRYLLSIRSIDSFSNNLFQKILKNKYICILKDDDDIKLLKTYKSFIIFGTMQYIADPGTGNAVATGLREHNHRCLHQDRVQLAIERDRLHRSGGLLFSSAEEQMERLQSIGKGGWPVRIRWEGLPIEGHLRSCLRSFRWYSRFVGTAVARLLQVKSRKKNILRKKDPGHLSRYFDNNLNPVQSPRREEKKEKEQKIIHDPYEINLI